MLGKDQKLLKRTRGFKAMKQTKNHSISQIALRTFAILLLTIVPSGAFAQDATNPQLANRVRHELVTLPYYGVFDNLAYSIGGRCRATPYRQVGRPTARSQAARTGKRVSGVTPVPN